MAVRQKTIVGWALAALLGGAGAAAAATPVVFRETADQLRRVELIVPPDFAARCERKGRQVDCLLPDAPAAFLRTLRTIRGGAIDGVELLGRRADQVRFRITLRAEETAFVAGRLEAPPRWVIEAGDPLLVSDTVEDEVPFRPFPVAGRPFEPVLPDPALDPPAAADFPLERYRPCYEAWRSREWPEAVRACRGVARAGGEDAAARLATMALGDAWAGIAAAREGDADLGSVVEALGAAERAAAPDAVQQARYAVMGGRALRSMGLDARAVVYVEGRRERYTGTPGEAVLLAGLADLSRDDPAAVRPLLERLRDLPGAGRNTTAAVLTLAGQAYAEAEWFDALGLLDLARRRWPDDVTAHPGTLLQLAELFSMYGRRDEARALYEDLLDRFPDDAPHWVARVRLAELRAHTDPEGARLAMVKLVETLAEPEGQDLARLRGVRLTPLPEEQRRTLRTLRRRPVAEYLLPELLAQSARHALASGRLPEAYADARRIWSTWPRETLLERAPQLFDRILVLTLRGYAERGWDLASAGVYYADRARLEGSARRGLLLLKAGRALRRLAMYEEALGALQRGLRLPTARGEVGGTAELYLEMAAVLRRQRDVFRLREVLSYLDRRHPNRFDTFEYWAARGAAARWSGRPAEARDVYVHALNGPVSPEQRVELAGDIAEVYAEMKDVPKAVRALRTLLELAGEAGLDARHDRRRDAVWRIAELEYQGGARPAAVSALSEFLEAFPGDPDRFEARYLKGRALADLGDAAGAAREWDRVAADPNAGFYARLAARELEMLRWQAASAAGVLRAAGLTGRSEEPSEP